MFELFCSLYVCLLLVNFFFLFFYLHQLFKKKNIFRINPGMKINMTEVEDPDAFVTWLANSCGYISGSMFCLALIPQIIRTVKTKSAKDMSYIHHYMCLTALIFNMAYSSYFFLTPVLIPAVVNFSLFITLHVLKCHYDGNCSKNKINI